MQEVINVLSVKLNFLSILNIIFSYSSGFQNTPRFFE